MSTVSFASFVMFLLSGLGTDLLDHAQSDVYWKAKHVVVSVDQLVAELAIPAGEDVTKLIRQLGAEDPTARETATQQLVQAGASIVPQLKKAADGPNREIATRATRLIDQLTLAGKGAAVRRLMAIRTLGEMKKAESLPALKALLGSKEPFVADYAASAIAAIEGKHASRRRATDAQRREDLNLLPTNIAVAAQYCPHEGAIRTLDDTLKAADMPSAEQREQFRATLTTQVIEVAEQIGNVRLEIVTGGLFPNAPNAPGYGVIVLRGKWDLAAITAMLQKQDTAAQSETLDGLTVLRKDPAAMIAVSDERLVVFVGDAAAQLPLAATIASIKNGGRDLTDKTEIAGVLNRVDRKADFWLAVHANDGLRQVLPDEAKSLDDLWLTVNLGKDDLLTIQWEGNGKNADGIKALSDELLRQAQSAAEQSESMPQFKTIAEFFKSVHVATEDGKMLGGATLKRGAMFAPIFMLTGGVHRSEVTPAPEPVKK